MSNFTRLSLAEALSPRALDELSSLRRAVPVIDASLANGGWICGGMMRHLLLDGSLEEYFTPQRGVEPFLPNARAGDVDLFFPNVESANRSAGASNRKVTRSLANFAGETGAVWDRRHEVRVQLVDNPDLVQPTIEDTLTCFDLINCQVGTDGESVYLPEGWHDLERSRLLGIAHNNTPFLGCRILKYLEFRGLTGLTDDSYEKLQGWFAHAGNDFKGGGWDSNHVSGVQGHVKRLRAAGLVRREDLIFFFNKWKKFVREKNYGMTHYYEVDWALDELGASAPHDLPNAVSDQ